MKIEKYINDAGEFRCFAFPNTFVWKKDVKRILESMPDVNITYFTKAMGAEVFCEFTFKGKQFEVSEPYGDNSYYDVLCTTPDTEELEYLYGVFSSHDVSHKVAKSNKVRIAVWSILILSLVLTYGLLQGS